MALHNGVERRLRTYVVKKRQRHTAIETFSMISTVRIEREDFLYLPRLILPSETTSRLNFN